MMPRPAVIHWTSPAVSAPALPSSWWGFVVMLLNRSWPEGSGGSWPRWGCRWSAGLPEPSLRLLAYKHRSVQRDVPFPERTVVTAGPLDAGSGPRGFRDVFLGSGGIIQPLDDAGQVIVRAAVRRPHGPDPHRDRRHRGGERWAGRRTASRWPCRWCHRQGTPTRAVPARRAPAAARRRSGPAPPRGTPGFVRAHWPAVPPLSWAVAAAIPRSPRRGRRLSFRFGHAAEHPRGDRP